MFNSDFFRGNRERLRTLFTGKAPIVLTANGLLQRSSDNTYHFRQDSSFWYLTGITIPDAVLVMDKDKEYIIVPDQQDYQRVFDGPILDEEIRSVSGIETILSQKEGWKQLSARLKRTRHIATLAPPAPYVDTHSFYTNPARANLIQKVKTYNQSMETLDLRQHLAVMRMVKQPVELEAIKKAIAITISSVDRVRKKLDKYEYEYQIEADLLHSFRNGGASGQAFHPIVAGGKNACTIHYFANKDNLAQSRFVLLDVGAEVENYAADIGCTYWKEERNKREKNIYDAVVEVQQYAYSILKPGIIIKDYEKQIEQFMGEKLRELGLIKTIEHDAVRQYFPHATSHHVGLDAHDIADYKKPLEAGMVLAVEPGIYIPNEAIGIRIEHNILITSNGLQILSKNLLQ
jgi:Xaa-Pro aminopeptidase